MISHSSINKKRIFSCLPEIFELQQRGSDIHTLVDYIAGVLGFLAEDTRRVLRHTFPAYANRTLDEGSSYFDYPFELDQLAELVSVKRHPWEDMNEFQRRLQLEQNLYKRGASTPRGILGLVAALLACQLTEDFLFKEDGTIEAQCVNFESWRNDQPTKLSLCTNSLKNHEFISGPIALGQNFAVKNNDYTVSPLIHIKAINADFHYPLIENQSSHEVFFYDGIIKEGQCVQISPSFSNKLFTYSGARTNEAIFSKELDSPKNKSQFADKSVVNNADLQCGENIWLLRSMNPDLVKGLCNTEGIREYTQNSDLSLEVKMRWQTNERAAFKLLIPLEAFEKRIDDLLGRLKLLGEEKKFTALYCQTDQSREAAVELRSYLAKNLIKAIWKTVDQACAAGVRFTIEFPRTPFPEEQQQSDSLAVGGQFSEGHKGRDDISAELKLKESVEHKDVPYFDGIFEHTLIGLSRFAPEEDGHFDKSHIGRSRFLLKI